MNGGGGGVLVRHRQILWLYGSAGYTSVFPSEEGEAVWERWRRHAILCKGSRAGHRACTKDTGPLMTGHSCP